MVLEAYFKRSKEEEIQELKKIIKNQANSLGGRYKQINQLKEQNKRLKELLDYNGQNLNPIDRINKLQEKNVRLKENLKGLSKRNKKKKVLIEEISKLKEENHRLKSSLGNIKREINTANLSSSIRHKVFKRDGYKCVECGATNKDTMLTINHIIPRIKGGSNCIDNLQTLCKYCNNDKASDSWKGNLLQEEVET